MRESAAMQGVVRNERELLAVAIALGARDVAGWSARESDLTADLPPASVPATRWIRDRIHLGHDPLGDLFCTFRSPAERRPHGATYTPLPIVRLMVRWAKAMSPPQHIVDPGTGSARFLIAAGRRFPSSRLVGVELDPAAAILARAHLAAAALAPRAEVIVGDFREVTLPVPAGSTLFLGNPPYVRHHAIDRRWKAWLVEQASAMGLNASQLAGLYVHFFLATVLKAQPGDAGMFITAAEWLDVNYGRLLRQLFLGRLGGRSIATIEPTVQTFPDAATTATITCFQIAERPSNIRIKRVRSIAAAGGLNEGGRLLRRERLASADRWSPLGRAARKTAAGYVELGELCRVHRGQVTGANRVWIAGEHSRGVPDAYQFASVTRAHELFAASPALIDATRLRRVIDLPHDLDAIAPEDRRAVEAFLERARRMGADRGYIATTRKPWWAVGLREPAPILATYMARRPPAFVRNLAAVRHINVAHGIYPREPMPEPALDALATFLSRHVSLSSGRTYAGGLTKFEPKEMERLLVPLS